MLKHNQHFIKDTENNKNSEHIDVTDLIQSPSLIGL